MGDCVERDSFGGRNGCTRIIIHLLEHSIETTIRVRGGSEVCHLQNHLASPLAKNLLRALDPLGRVINACYTMVPGVKQTNSGVVVPQPGHQHPGISTAHQL